MTAEPLTRTAELWALLREGPRTRDELMDHFGYSRRGVAGMVENLRSRLHPRGLDVVITRTPGGHVGALYELVGEGALCSWPGCITRLGHWRLGEAPRSDGRRLCCVHDTAATRAQVDAEIAKLHAASFA